MESKGGGGGGGGGTGGVSPNESEFPDTTLEVSSLSESRMKWITIQYYIIFFIKIIYPQKITSIPKSATQPNMDHRKLKHIQNLGLVGLLTRLYILIQLHLYPRYLQ